MDPDISIIESLSRNHLQTPAECGLNVTFLAKGGFNKVYTVAASYDGIDPQLSYVFRVTLPVEPFYKTASEVATLSYIREHTSVPVPHVIAHSSTADNELGYEWILMEKIPGVSLKSVWQDMDTETKERETRVVAQYAKQLCDWCSFDAIGNLYFRKDLLDGTVRSVPTTDDRFVVGPTVTVFMFCGGRKVRLLRNLGPYGASWSLDNAFPISPPGPPAFVRTDPSRPVPFEHYRGPGYVQCNRNHRLGMHRRMTGLGKHIPGIPPGTTGGRRETRTSQSRRG